MLPVIVAFIAPVVYKYCLRPWICTVFSFGSDLLVFCSLLFFHPLWYPVKRLINCLCGNCAHPCPNTHGPWRDSFLVYIYFFFWCVSLRCKNGERVLEHRFRPPTSIPSVFCGLWKLLVDWIVTSFLSNIFWCWWKDLCSTCTKLFARHCVSCIAPVYISHALAHVQAFIGSRHVSCLLL